MKPELAKENARTIISLYEQFGNEDYIGENVSQIEHMCQSAQLAIDKGYDDEVILAAFLHDIGHLCEHIQPTESMRGYGVHAHEKIGAAYLKGLGFSDRIVNMVSSHVAAKRYLTFRFPEYYEQLSEASKQTLILQGGVMSETEANEFEADPLWQIYIALRKWDEQAKVNHIPIPSLLPFENLIIQHLENQD
jgi:phosphonate degradation associated HDIG domain protein